MTDVIHKYVRDLYSKRFPELESLVHTPLEYIRTVQVGVVSVPVGVAIIVSAPILPAVWVGGEGGVTWV